MATNLIGAIADQALAALENPAVAANIEAKIASGEIQLETLLESAIKNLPHQGGLVGLILPALEAEGVSVVKLLVANYPAATIFGWIVALATDGAHAVGG